MATASNLRHTAPTGRRSLSHIHLGERHVTLKVVAYVILVVAVIFTAGAIATVRLSYRKATENAHSESEKSLTSTVELLESKLERIENATLQAARLSILLDQDPETAYSLLDHLCFSCPELMGVCLMFKENQYPSKGRMYAPQTVDFDGDGIYERFDATQYGFTYLDGEDDNWNASSKGEKFWSRTFENRYREKSYLFSYSVPMYDSKGDFMGIICAEVSLDFLHETMESLKPVEESLFIIVSEDNDILCYSEKDLAMTSLYEEYKTQDPAYQELFTALHDKGSGMVEFTGPDKAFAYYRHFPKCNWGIAFSYPYSYIMKGPEEITGKMIKIDIAVLALLFAVLFFGILKIITPFSTELRETTRERAGLENELRLSAVIQQEMIPDETELLRIRKDIDICAVLKPAKMVGGDFYDCYIRDGKLFFCIGDVSGKGMPAALFMSMTRSLFRLISRHQDNPATILSELNREICAANSRSMFCTLFAGVLDLETGKMQYCNGGHNPPVIVRSASAEARFADVCGCCPLGAFDDSEFVSGWISLEEGDLLLLYTDGITEAEDADRALFGEERLIRTLSLSAAQQSDVRQTVDSVLAAVASHSKDAVQSDDITLLALKFRRIRVYHRIHSDV